MSPALLVSMKTTLILIVAYMILIVFGTISALLLLPWDILNAATLVVLPLFVVLFILCRRAKPLAYLATAVLGAIITVGSAPVFGTPTNLPLLLVWEGTISTLLGLLIALEASRAYLEMSRTQR